MRAPLVALLLLTSSACAITPQWDGCTLEGCSEDPEGDRAACLAECAGRPEPRCVGDDTAACEVAHEAWRTRNCAVECSAPACSGTCPADYACIGTSEARHCRQRCETPSDCTDPGTAANGETTCNSTCGVSCNTFHGDDDCPPETRCVGGAGGSGAGVCRP